jgi:cell division protein ZapA
MESEIATLRKTRDEALVKADGADAALTGALSTLAERMEGLATRLNAERPAG